MSYGGYNPYGNNGGGRGYGSNPFDDRNALQYGAGAHEMSSFNPGNSPQVAQQGYGSPRAPNQKSTLDECVDIQNGIREVQNQLLVLASLEKRALDDADMSSGSNTKRDLDNLTQSIMDQYRLLTDRVRTVKSRPDARSPTNGRHVDKTDRELREAIQKFQEIEAGARKETTAQMERQARIAFPDATDAEITEMVRSDTQIFQQAVLGSRGERANRVLNLHKARKMEMEKIEKDLMDLLVLMDQMQEILTKDEAVIQSIEDHTQTAKEDLVKSNVELQTATKSALGARRKKWICLGICVLIVVIIVVAVVAYFMINKPGGGGGGGGGNNDSNDNNNVNNNPGNADNTAGNTDSNAGNTDTSAGTENTGGQKRSPFARNVMDDLQMNTAHAVRMSPDIAPAPRRSRRLASRAQGARRASNAEIEALVKKRFVVDWEGVDSTGSDD
ncbi:t-SNARE [Corynascus similis CBS 632.67]